MSLSATSALMKPRAVGDRSGSARSTDAGRPAAGREHVEPHGVRERVGTGKRGRPARMPDQQAPCIPRQTAKTAGFLRSNGQTLNLSSIVASMPMASLKSEAKWGAERHSGNKSQTSTQTGNSRSCLPGYTWQSSGKNRDIPPNQSPNRNLSLRSRHLHEVEGPTQYAVRGGKCINNRPLLEAECQRGY
jgi:hypothetical protein